MAQPTCPKLPSGFATVREILEGKRRMGTVVTVAGLVTDFRAPIPTRGNDWKCQLRIYDQSVEDDASDSLLLNIFWPADAMPDASCGDVVVIFAAKVQQFNSEPISLITTYNGASKTAVHIYSAAKIPKPPGEASAAMQPSKRGASRQPSKADNEFVSALYYSIDKGRVPDASEFESMTVTSVNVKDKFCELKDLRDGRFADTIVQIVRAPYDLGDKMTLWVSDYSENQSFYHFSFSGGNATGPPDDPYGYLADFPNGKQKPEWTGPFGRRSIQVTCYEPHASVIRNRQLSDGSWISLRNLQIKFGHNGSNLEGYLREDRGAQGAKINIVPLDITQGPETINPQLRNAIRRKRDYEKAKKGQLENIAEAARAGQKRKAAQGSDAEPAKLNAKARRKANREQMDKESKQEETAPIAIPDLNQQVKCENNTKPASFVADILDPVHHKTTVDGEAVDLQLPFINANYRTNVRVVDFMPSNLKDFSCPKKASEYDVLSDHDESESESESEPEQDTMTKFTTERAWEWRFFLELEDAVVKYGQQKRRIWVLVDNQAAQCLMDRDATDLGRDRQNLEALRQRLFLLWGDLEEHKSRAPKRAPEAQHDGPPDHSSDEARAAEEPQAQVANRPFSCCIRQYGVKVAEQDALQADAGNWRRWQRMFGLFGTRIAMA